MSLPVAAGLAYREALPDGWEGTGPTALLVHGWPNSSYAWRAVLPALAACGWRALAPDLPGYGDSAVDPPGTWERHVDALERFHAALGLGPVALCVHDWGGLIGLRWACDHPGVAASALVISNTGFFPDGKWHGMAQTFRTEVQGEAAIGAITREVVAAVLRQASPRLPDAAIDEYWKCLADEARRRGALELYRSGDFEKLLPYAGALAALDVPTLVLWGAQDEFAPLAGARRLQAEIPGAELVVLEDAGHFVMEDEPERFASEIAAFLGALA